MTLREQSMTFEQWWHQERLDREYGQGDHEYNFARAAYCAGAEAQRERDADLANLFRALINALDYLRAARDGHVHSADGSANCIGCCIVAEGEHAANSYKAKLRTPATSPEPFPICAKIVNDHGFVPDVCQRPLGHEGKCKWWATSPGGEPADLRMFAALNKELETVTEENADLHRQLAEAREQLETMRLSKELFKAKYESSKEPKK